MPSKAFDCIFDLCADRKSSESELISQIESVLRTNSDVLNEKETRVYHQTLLHIAAAKRRSVEFTKLLVETGEGHESVRATDNHGYLPIHLACYYCNLEVAKYLHRIYQESINLVGNDGLYPLHCALWDRAASAAWDSMATDEDLEDLIRYLLLHDQGAVSKPVLTDNNATALALHLACER
jgi:ankyrin repeat protein